MADGLLFLFGRSLRPGGHIRMILQEKKELSSVANPGSEDAARPRPSPERGRASTRRSLSKEPVENVLPTSDLARKP